MPPYIEGGGVERTMEENIAEMKLSTSLALPLKLSKPHTFCIDDLSLNNSLYRARADNGKLPGIKEGNFRSSEVRVIKRQTVDLVEDEELSSGAQAKKLRLSKHQSELLEENFREQATLNPRQKNDLAQRLNLRPRQVEVWFQNRRARSKLKRQEVERENLRRWCEVLREENARLERELRHLRAMEITDQERGMKEEGCYMRSSSSAATLSLCSSCASEAARSSRSV